MTVLQGMPLTSLVLTACSQVQDLTPLRGMPLVKLYITGCGQVSDLTPLEGMQLTEFTFYPKSGMKGMSVIRQMKSLHTIGVGWTSKMPAAEFWKRYDAGEFNK